MSQFKKLCILLLVFCLLSFWDGLAITQTVKKTGIIRETVWSDWEEIRYASDGDMALKVKTRIYRKGLLSSRRGKPLAKYLILPKAALADHINTRSESPMDFRRDKFAKNTLLTRVDLYPDDHRDHAYIIPPALTTGIRNISSQLPDKFGEKVTIKILKQDLYDLFDTRGYSKHYNEVAHKYQYENGRLFFPDQPYNAKRYVQFHIEHQGNWEKKTWFWYPVQLARFGPSQLLDIVCIPIYVFRGCRDFNRAFGG